MMMKWRVGKEIGRFLCMYLCRPLLYFISSWWTESEAQVGNVHILDRTWSKISCLRGCVSQMMNGEEGRREGGRLFVYVRSRWRRWWERRWNSKNPQTTDRTLGRAKQHAWETVVCVCVCQILKVEERERGRVTEVVVCVPDDHGGGCQDTTWRQDMEENYGHVWASVCHMMREGKVIGERRRKVGQPGMRHAEPASQPRPTDIPPPLPHTHTPTPTTHTHSHTITNRGSTPCNQQHECDAMRVTGRASVIAEHRKIPNTPRHPSIQTHQIQQHTYQHTLGLNKCDNTRHTHRHAREGTHTMMRVMWSKKIEVYDAKIMLNTNLLAPFGPPSTRTLLQDLTLILAVFPTLPGRFGFGLVAILTPRHNERQGDFQ